MVAIKFEWNTKTNGQLNIYEGETEVFININIRDINEKRELRKQFADIVEELSD